MKKPLMLNLALFEKINKLAQVLGCEREYVLEMAIDDFIEKSQVKIDEV